MPDTLAERAFLSPKEVEAIYGIPVSTLSFWRNASGSGPKFTRVGDRRIKYRRADIESWLQELNPDA